MDRGVLLVGPVAPPSGGVATHVAQLDRALRERGVSSTVVDPRRRGADGTDGRPRLLARLLQAAARGDLVHLHTNGHNRGSWMLAAISSLGRTLGDRPSLLTLHSGLAPAFMRSHHRLVRTLCDRYTFVIAVNPEIADALGRAGVPADRVVVCAAFSTAALQFRLPPPGLRALRRRHPLLLACALAPGREYGADVLLDGFAALRARLPDAGLAIYGPGTRSPELAAEIAARGLAGSVHQLGELGRERALAVVAACDLFVRPTRADGDALSVREALALGRPVVASNVGTRPPEAALFAAGDAAALVETIFHVLGKGDGQLLPPTDCLPPLLALYRRCGVVEKDPATVGTGLAILPVRGGEPACVGSPDG